MSYKYVRRTSEEIRKIARGYLEKFKACRIRTHAVDIERILEELGFEVIYRQSLGVDGLKGYAAYEGKYIVVSEFSRGADIRYTISHELSHKILEFELWQNGKIPAGAQCHELSPEQNKDIEANAWELAAELLEPYPEFPERYRHHYDEALVAGKSHHAACYIAVRTTAEDFYVIPRAAALRAKRLNLITEAEHKALFPTNLM